MVDESNRIQITHNVYALDKNGRKKQAWFFSRMLKFETTIEKQPWAKALTLCSTFASSIVYCNAVQLTAVARLLGVLESVLSTFKLNLFSKRPVVRKNGRKICNFPNLIVHLISSRPGLSFSLTSTSHKYTLILIRTPGGSWKEMGG